VGGTGWSGYSGRAGSVLYFVSSECKGQLLGANCTHVSREEWERFHHDFHWHVQVWRRKILCNSTSHPSFFL